jgi:hypothetical protein
MMAAKDLLDTVVRMVLSETLQARARARAHALACPPCAKCATGNPLSRSQRRS